MWKLMTIAALVSISFSAQAKLTVFRNQNAIQTVLNDAKTMNQIASQQANAEMTSISVSSNNEGLNKVFTVRIARTTNTPIGNRSCFNDVTVASEGKTVRIPGGGVIATNQLVIKEVSQALCQK